MLGYLRRLATAGAAYQAADVVARVLALVTLPIYTRYLTAADYGVAETLLTAVILLSIPLRLGLGEAFVRFWFLDDDPGRRRRLARTTTATVALTTTLAALAALPFADPLAEALLGVRDGTLLAYGLLGLWAFANLEVAKALLRVEERWRAFVWATLANVLLTVGLTLVLVVGEDAGARGYVAGNYVASAVVLVALWIVLRDRVGLVPSGGLLGPLLRFGLPTVPAEATVFALNVLDRAYLLRAESPRAAGLYALSVKLSSVVIVAVRGFQYAWPPLAYSVRDDDEARRVYALVVTWYCAVTGVVVAAVTLLGRWLVRLLADPSFFAAHEALPWVALGWALYGLVLVFVVIAGRVGLTARTVPAALAGLVVNAVALVVLVEPLGIAGAGIALCLAYVATLAVLHALTRRHFAIAFERGRLARLAALLGGGTVVAELVLPTTGAVGLAARALVAAGLPLAVVATGFLSGEERAWLRGRLNVARR